MLSAWIIYFFTCTTPGLQLDVAIASHFLPGKLQIEKMEGNLISEFSFQDISYKQQETDIKIQYLHFSWTPYQLAFKRFYVNHFSLKNAVIKINPISDSENKVDSTPLNETIKNNLKWLSFITIKQLDINNVMIEQDFQHFVKINFAKLQKIQNETLFATDLIGKFKNYPLQGNIDVYCNNQKLQIQKLMLAIADSKLKMSGSVAEDWNMQWQLNIPHLEKLISNYAGNIVSNGTIYGARLSPAIKAKAQSNQLVIEGERFRHVQTDLNSKLKFSGSFSKPHLSGDINFTQGRIELAQLGIMLQKINLHFTPSLDQPFALNGTFQSGSGNGQLQGKIDFTQSTIPMTLTLQGNNLEIVNLPEYKIIASPNLTLDIKDDSLKLHGKIDIPFADITPKDYSSTITLPDEVVFVGKKQTEITIPYNITMNIELKLGEKISLAYENLKTSLGGNLTITQEPGYPMTATGELYAIDGTYKAYGQLLKIQDGKLIFAGGLISNPGLNIRATRQIKTAVTNNGSSSFNNSGLTPIYMGTELLTVGVFIQGTVDNPTITLFSNPTGLSQADILSYLAFDVPQAKAAGQAPGALLNLLSSFNLGGKTQKITGVKEGLQNKLGLNEMNVETTQLFNPSKGTVVSTPSFVLGKELAPNLYVHYSISLFEQISILNLRYQLNKHWAIQSETSKIDNGADLLYGIERD